MSRKNRQKRLNAYLKYKDVDSVSEFYEAVSEIYYQEKKINMEVKWLGHFCPSTFKLSQGIFSFYSE